MYHFQTFLFAMSRAVAFGSSTTSAHTQRQYQQKQRCRWCIVYTLIIIILARNFVEQQQQQ